MYTDIFLSIKQKYKCFCKFGIVKLKCHAIENYIYVYLFSWNQQLIGQSNNRSRSRRNDNGDKEMGK